jgi:ATP-binding cassette subfamily B protein
MFTQASSQWRWLAGIAALWLLATPLALLTPVPLQVAVDNVIGKHPLPGYLSWTLPGGLARSHVAVLILATVLMALIVVLTEVVWLAAWLAGEYTGERLTLRFRSDLFAHAQRLSLVYHDKRGTADSAYRIESDAPAIRYLIVDGLIPFLASAVTVGSMLYVTVRLDWQLGLVALAISPVLFYLVQGSRSRLRHQAHKSKHLESSALGVVQEVFSTLRVVKAFGQEPREYERFVQTSRDGTNARVRQALTAGLYGVAATLVIGLGSAAVLYVGVLHVEARMLTLGSLILVIGYLTTLYAPLKTMSRQVGGLQTHLASADRAFALLDEKLEIRDRQGASPLTRAAGRIAFRGVSFGYDALDPVLEDIWFDIPAGSRVGIFGPTGAGKTTILNLLMRLYDPSVGQILLDDRDIRDYRLADLRTQFAIVLQDPVLFSTTIRENISYGRPDAPLERIIAAARAANAHDFIDALPAGYETVVSERGVSLSGGERQRIALARAFLKDAPILLLDEPTSSVDRGTEGSILSAVGRLMEGRTTLLITHHLSALDVCDLHIELRAGRLIDDGAGNSRSASA